MIIERPADRREVMIHFISIEEGRRPTKYETNSITELEDIVRHKCYSKGTNPFGVYIVGAASDRRNEKIDKWVLARIPCKELYSCGVDDKWNPCLNKNKGNLLATVTCCPHLVQIDEQQGMSEFSKIIVTVKQITPGKIGEFEVIDGFHRVGRLIHDGNMLVSSYVGLSYFDRDFQ